MRNIRREASEYWNSQAELIAEKLDELLDKKETVGLTEEEEIMYKELNEEYMSCNEASFNW